VLDDARPQTPRRFVGHAAEPYAFRRLNLLGTVTWGFLMRIRAFLIAFLVVAASILTAVQANAAATVYIYKV
jgi:hypothetical protein